MNSIETINQIMFSQNFENFKNALSQYDIHEQDCYGNNILHYYIKGSKRDYKDMCYKATIDAILSKGLDINERQGKGNFKKSLAYCHCCAA